MNSLSLIFSCITVASALMFLGLILLLHFLPNRFNPVKNTVSDYVAALSGKYRFAKVAMPLFGALSTLSLAVAIATNAKVVSAFVILFLIISGICRFLLIFFPTDITGQPSTKVGRLHLTFAIVSFAGIAFAAANFHLTSLDGTIGQVVVVAAILLLVGFLPQIKKIFGLLERIFLSLSVLWLIIVGLELLHRTVL